MDESGWLSALKMGDEVFLSGRFGIAVPFKVKRTTPTQIIIEVGSGLDACEEKFQRKTGRSVDGDIWSRTYLQMPTDELRNAFELDKLTRRAKRLKEGIIIPTSKAELLQLNETLSTLNKSGNE